MIRWLRKHDADFYEQGEKSPPTVCLVALSPQELRSKVVYESYLHVVSRISCKLLQDTCLVILFVVSDRPHIKSISIYGHRSKLSFAIRLTNKKYLIQ